MNRLLVDAGNTFIKWVWDLGSQTPDWIDLAQPGRFLTAELFEAGGPERLFKAVQSSLSAGSQKEFCSIHVWASSVLGDQGADLLAKAFNAEGWCFSMVKPEFPGFESCYLNLASLGRDRWTGSMAVAMRSSSKFNLLVSLGTATTIDCIRVDQAAALGLKALHLGGVILPGFDLMSRSLAGATKQLPEVQASPSGMPRSTEQAIALGVLQAQTGAVRQMADRLQQEAPGEVIELWVTGGAADLLAEGLEMKAAVRSALVLEGVWHASRVQGGGA